jgi:hypothetical protein
MNILRLEESHVDALAVLLRAKTKAEINRWATQRIDHAVSYLRTEHREAMENYFRDPDPQPEADLPF